MGVCYCVCVFRRAGAGQLFPIFPSRPFISPVTVFVGRDLLNRWRVPVVTSRRSSSDFPATTKMFRRLLLSLSLPSHVSLQPFPSVPVRSETHSHAWIISLCCSSLSLVYIIIYIYTVMNFPGDRYCAPTSSRQVPVSSILSLLRKARTEVRRVASSSRGCKPCGDREGILFSRQTHLPFSGESPGSSLSLDA